MYHFGLKPSYRFALVSKEMDASTSTPEPSIEEQRNAVEAAFINAANPDGPQTKRRLHSIGSESVPRRQGALRIYSHNVNGIERDNYPSRVATLADRLDVLLPHVVCLQEMTDDFFHILAGHRIMEQYRVVKERDFGTAPCAYYTISFVNEDAASVVSAETLRLPSAFRRRALLLHLRLHPPFEACILTIANVHLESGQGAQGTFTRGRQLDALMTYAAGNEHSAIVFVVGDTNLRNSAELPPHADVQFHEAESPSTYRRQRYDRVFRLVRSPVPDHSLATAELVAFTDPATAQISDHLALICDVDAQ